ncbi:MAG: hypothetical protein M0R03_00220 [Novosphingobium sp.]|nr:hypothetical protein [Novosphingobium sp.]
MRGPCVQATLRTGEIPEPLRHAITQVFCGTIADGSEGALPPPLAVPDNLAEPEKSVAWFLGLMGWITLAADLPVAGEPRRVAGTARVAHFVFPVVEGGLGPAAALLNIMLEMIAGTRRDDHAGREQILSHFRNLARAKNATSNGPRFMRAAHERGIAVLELPGQTIQFGLGSRSRLIEGGFTDKTSTIGTRTARSKAWTSQMLQRLRIPVAPHRAVTTIEAAISAAEALGYPVVVKPNDRDGGTGVRADLRNETELRIAFDLAKTFADILLVEKHFEGNDYRLLVHEGKLMQLIMRIPAGVTGDGVSTVEELVRRLNADPRRSSAAHYVLMTIELDNEALELLARAGLSPGSVLLKGQFFKLRRTANIARGGMPRRVMAHPDNVVLAHRAAKALGLDLAGVDIICPDIGRSWLEVGAIVSEVNAGPELGGELPSDYADLLDRIVEGKGDIPTAVAVGAHACEVGRMLAAGASALSLRPGLHDENGLTVAGETVDPRAMSCFAAGRALASNREVDAIVLALVTPHLIETGLPVPCCDMLVLTGELSAGPDTRDEAASLELLRLLCGVARHIVVANDASPDGQQVRERLTRLGIRHEAADESAIIEKFTAVCRAVFPEQADATP